MTVLISVIPIYLPSLLRGDTFPRVGNFGIYPNWPNANRGGSDMVVLFHFVHSYCPVVWWTSNFCLNTVSLRAQGQYSFGKPAVASTHRVTFSKARLTRSSIPFSSGWYGIVVRGKDPVACTASLMAADRYSFTFSECTSCGGLPNVVVVYWMAVWKASKTSARVRRGMTDVYLVATSVNVSK